MHAGTRSHKIAEVKRKTHATGVNSILVRICNFACEGEKKISLKGFTRFFVGASRGKTLACANLWPLILTHKDWNANPKSDTSVEESGLRGIAPGRLSPQIRSIGKNTCKLFLVY